MTLSVPCPRCGKPIEADESKELPQAFPFCTERCRLIDLGKWFDEEFRIPGKPAPLEPPAPDAE